MDRRFEKHLNLRCRPSHINLYTDGEYFEIPLYLLRRRHHLLIYSPQILFSKDKDKPLFINCVLANHRIVGIFKKLLIELDLNMNSPNYEWRCPQCNQANAAHTDHCASCNASYLFKVKDLPVITEAQSSTASNVDDVFKILWMFFPEGLVALGVLIYSPIWIIKLLTSDQFLLALCLSIGTISAIFGFIQGCKLRNKWISYGSMMLLLVLAYFVSTGSS